MFPTVQWVRVTGTFSGEKTHLCYSVIFSRDMMQGHVAGCSRDMEQRHVSGRDTLQGRAAGTSSGCMQQVNVAVSAAGTCCKYMQRRRKVGMCSRDMLQGHAAGV